MVTIEQVNKHHGIDPFSVFAGAVAFLVASTWVTCFNETGARTFWGIDRDSWQLKKVFYASMVVTIIGITVFMFSYAVSKRKEAIEG